MRHLTGLDRANKTSCLSHPTGRFRVFYSIYSKSWYDVITLITYLKVFFLSFYTKIQSQLYMNQIYEEKLKIDNTEMQIFTMFLLFKSWKKLWTLKNENCFRFLPLVVLQHTHMLSCKSIVSPWGLLWWNFSLWKICW